MTTENDFLGTATYSPEDNKLRFYAFARLSKEDYQRAKDSGFKWAPKQELFFAPAWTPGREDLLIEWCGEIDDEDKTLTERQEERAERFEEYSDNRAKDADSAHKAVAAIADNIPFGQPILVGHHSEKRARRDAAKIENGMRRAVKAWEQSKYWTDRAASAIRHAKYKELPSVRARRIKTIEADKRKTERTKAHAENVLKFWRGEMKGKKKGTDEIVTIAVTRASALWFSNSYDHCSQCYPLDKYPRTNADVSTYEGQMGLWSALGGNINGEDPEHVAIISPEQAAEISIKAHAGSLERCNRWIAHYENRLAYERAMLADSGGIATDRTGPEKGGACKCWASHRGGFSYIVKVNQVTVTVLDNWGNTNADGSPGRNFTRTIPFDKLSGIMTADEVETARNEKRLIEYPDKTGFILADGPPKSENPVVQKLIDASESLADAPFDAMKASLAAGVQIVSAPQLFPTPPALAERMVTAAAILPGHLVLEPSAGTGAIVAELAKIDTETVAIEINSNLCGQLEKRFPSYRVNVRCADFLELNGELPSQFDRIVMNPPFADCQDIKHIRHAYGKLKAGGRLVAICANGLRQARDLKPWVENMGGTWEPLEPGAFTESGTNVNAVLITLERGEFTLQ